MSVQRTPFTEGVCQVLDIFYADREEGVEPDWEAIQGVVLGHTGGLYSFPVDILKAVWAVYEDEAFGLTQIWAVKHGVV